MGRTPVGGGPAFRFIPSEVRAHSKTSSFSSSPPFFVASSFWCRLLHVDFWHEVLGLLFCCVLDFSTVHFEKRWGDDVIFSTICVFLWFRVSSLITAAIEASVQITYCTSFLCIKHTGSWLWKLDEMFGKESQCSQKNWPGDGLVQKSFVN
jgi:hypothetical protein